MVKKQASTKESKKSKGEPKLLTKLSLFFFDRPRFSALLWLSIAIFGVLSYTVFLKREGFPQISTPYSIVSGAYIVNDPSKVDRDVTGPLSNKIVKVDGVKTVTASAYGNFYTIQIQYNDTVDSKTGNARVEQAVKDAKILPAQASALFQPLDFGSPNGKGDDILISFYAANNNVPTEQLVAKAKEAATYLQNSGKAPLAKSFDVDNPFVFAPNASGQLSSTQKNFDRFGIRQSEQTNFYNSVIIGVNGQQNFDVLKLDKQIHESITDMEKQPQFAGYTAQVSYSIAPSINQQISQLQRSLLEGLLAVLVFSALLIAFRASFITVGAMALVLLTTLGVLYVIGYTLNTITLFSLILALTLIVDDTIIMVEAIDAQRRKSKTARETVMLATQKISRAMTAATLTAVLAFSPLLFVGGILGSFIKAIPVTIISSLLVSLLVALTFIPFMSRGLLLRKNQLGHDDKDHESKTHAIEGFAAHALAGPLRWANHHKARLVTLGVSAVLVGFGFIVAAGFIFQKVTFNIFPPSKDTNGLILAFAYPPGTDINQAQAIADNADKLVGEQLGVNLQDAAYYNTGTAQKASLYVNLISYEKRAVTAPQLQKQLQQKFDSSFKDAKVEVSLQDVGGPAGTFTVRIETDNRTAGLLLANDMKTYLASTTLTRSSGKTAEFKSVTVSTPDAYYRHNGTPYVSVTGEFKDSDTTALVALAKTAVEKEFTDAKLQSYGLSKSNIVYDYGFESQNQDSFKTLLIAFPLVLVAIYILLLIEFRSLIQPILIFMAIPFSLFGITLGLYLSDNSFSFFSMLGFFALLGLSIKNTILLTDYANQARKAGEHPVEAIALALEQRFRPLVATSITAIVSLIPLALSNPFWQGLAIVLMCGLLSSTLLVIIVFPYYYLGAEYLRIKSKKLALRVVGKSS